jgi:DNA-binding NtrC family response regulator
MITSNGKSIVVVDDKRDIVNQIKRSLEAMDGLKVYKFTDPFAALEHFNPGCKDHHIVISDIRMPILTTNFLLLNYVHVFTSILWK